MALPGKNQQPDGWLSPPQGWPRRQATRFIRLSAVFGSNGDLPWRSIVPLLGRLQVILGDHEAMVTALNLKGSAWESEFPWHKSQFAYVKLPLSVIADESRWSRLLEGIVDPRYSTIRAHRGGRAHRHLVWSLNSEQVSHGGTAIQLTLATRHIHERSAAALTDLIKAFFEISTAASGLVGGYGEIAHLDPLDSGWGMSRADTGTDGWIAAGFISCDLELGLPVACGPRWLTLLTGNHVRRLGGIEALRSRARAAELRAFGPGKKFLGPLDAGIRIEPLGECALIPLHGGEDLLTGGSFRSPRDSLPLPGIWLYHELSHAGLLAHSNPDRLELYLSAQERARRPDAADRDTRRRTQAGAERKRLDSEAIRSLFAEHPPRCIRGRSVREDKPPKFELHENCACLRVVAKSSEEGLTVYTRRAGDEEGGFSLALVGSLKPERAALYFDSRIHGYDGEQSDPVPERARPMGRVKQLTCPKCKGRHFHVYAVFECSDDEDTAQEEARRQDSYSWFWLVSKCLYCRWAGTVCDVECA